MDNHPASTPLTTRSSRTVIVLLECIQTLDGEPFGPQSEGRFLLRLGALLAGGSSGRLLVCSVMGVPKGESVSAYSVAAQSRRQDLERLALAAFSQATGVGEAGLLIPAEVLHTHIAPVVRVAPESDLGAEVRRLLSAEPDSLLLLPLPLDGQDIPAWLRRAVRSPLPCDIAWARAGVGDHEVTYISPLSEARPLKPGTQHPAPPRVLVPARGGPQATLSMDIARDLITGLNAEITLLHVVQHLPEMERATEEAPFTEFLHALPDIESGMVPLRIVDASGDAAQTISNAASGYNLLIMGAGDEPAVTVGSFTEQVARQTSASLLVVKSRVPVAPAIRAARRRARPHVLDADTLSLLVDKWFAENTFHAEEFSDLGRLIDIKRSRNITISVGLPALNEEDTIADIIKVLKTTLMQDVPLLDEIVLIDSNSTDGTREIARDLGIPVFIHQEVLPEAGPPLVGKGEALWKSLHVLKGDIIAWVDTDVANMHPQFVYGLIGPLLREPHIGYIKGYYHRPIKAGDDLQHEGGGRVTELTVRPLLNLFFPLLSGLVQPLAGEYAGRREVLEQLPFFSGYGVETGMLIDLLERFGLPAIGQVNLERRVHRNRSLADLSLTAFAIVQVILTRLEERAHISLLQEVNRSMKLIRFEKDHLSLMVRQVRDTERPPIVTIPAYRAAHPPR